MSRVNEFIMYACKPTQYPNIMQPVIARTISSYLSLRDCWTCQIALPSWEFFVSSVFFLSHGSEHRLQELIDQLGDTDKSTRVAIQGDGPTCPEGAFILMKLALDSFAPKRRTNLVSLDLQKHSINFEDWENMLRERSFCLAQLDDLALTLHHPDSSYLCNEQDPHPVLFLRSLTSLHLKLHCNWDSVCYLRLLRALQNVRKMELDERLVDHHGIAEEPHTPPSMIVLYFNNLSVLRCYFGSLLFKYLLVSGKEIFPKLKNLHLDCLSEKDVHTAQRVVTDQKSLEDIQTDYSIVWDRGTDSDCSWCSQCDSAIKEAKESTNFISKILHHRSSPPHLHLHLNALGEEDNVNATVVQLLTQSTYSILSIECCRPEGRLDGSLIVKYLRSSVCSRACLHIFGRPLPPSLTELRISAELCYNFIHTKWPAQLNGIASGVRTLTISPERWLLPLWSSLGTPVTVRDLGQLLVLFPSLMTLTLCTRCLIRCRGLEDILFACSHLRRLYLHSRAFESVHGLLVQLRLSKAHQRLEVLLFNCPYDIMRYDLADVQNLPALRYLLLRLGSSSQLVVACVADLFERLSSLEWFVYISPVQCRTFVCSRMSPGATLEFVVLETDKIPALIQRLPQLNSVFWERLLELA
ncbi:unnamed protein product [Schistocephalus solidus]|uniref:Mab-21 domain-containing protein n=1 Tax=Schistocephalus solidus TaxID=70667 RepID=A0A183TEK5_SCHSO|nr:unnamed protein product [Schistocephalus solidus]